jgi:hypothetical protein
MIPSWRLPASRACFGIEDKNSLDLEQLLGSDCCSIARTHGPSMGISALPWFERHLICFRVVLSTVRVG